MRLQRHIEKLNKLKDEVNYLYIKAVHCKNNKEKDQLMNRCHKLLKEYASHKEWVIQLQVR